MSDFFKYTPQEIIIFGGEEAKESRHYLLKKTLNIVGLRVEIFKYDEQRYIYFFTFVDRNVMRKLKRFQDTLYKSSNQPRLNSEWWSVTCAVFRIWNAPQVYLTLFYIC